LNTGSKVGIGVGVGIGVPFVFALAGLAYYFKKHQQPSAPREWGTGVQAHLEIATVEPLQRQELEA
jgi:hypothetical protein